MSLIIFDIETTMTRGDDVVFESSMVPLGNAKKEETVQRKIQEASDNFRKERHKKGALDPTVSEVLSIGMLHYAGDGMWESAYWEQGHDDEKAVLLKFFRSVDQADLNTTWANQNLLGFDLPFLNFRAKVLGIRFPTVFNRRSSAGYRLGDFIDTRKCFERDMEDLSFNPGGRKGGRIQFSSHTRKPSSGLSAQAKLHGLPDKKMPIGETIENIANWSFEARKQYCMHDCWLVAKLIDLNGYYYFDEAVNIPSDTLNDKPEDQIPGL